MEKNSEMNFRSKGGQYILSAENNQLLLYVYQEDRMVMLNCKKDYMEGLVGKFDCRLQMETPIFYECDDFF